MKDIVIPQELVQATQMSEQELLLEIAVMLFVKEKLTLEQASHFARQSQYQFQHILASRKIPVHYDVDELLSDLETLKNGRCQ